MRLSRSMRLTSMLAMCVISVFPSRKPRRQSFKPVVLEQVDLGHVPAGERITKLTLLELQPGAEIPPHTHKGPGLRYVVEGAISIAWKDRGTGGLQGGIDLF